MIIPSFDEMDDAVEGLLELFEDDGSESLADLIKASFGGDRSAAGRYAAEQRWKNRIKEQSKTFNQITGSQFSDMLFFANEKRKKQNDNPDVSNEAHKAYGLWVTQSYQLINRMLREQGEFGEQNRKAEWNASITPQEAADAIKKHFDDFAIEMPFDARVFRGVQSATHLGSIQVGTVMRDKGLASCSTLEGVAREWADGAHSVPAIIEIHVPRGTKVWCPPNPFKEQEVTLAPNTALKVKEVVETTDKYGQVLKIVAEVIND